MTSPATRRSSARNKCNRLTNGGVTADADALIKPFKPRETIQTNTNQPATLGFDVYARIRVRISSFPFALSLFLSPSFRLLPLLSPSSLFLSLGAL